MDGFLNSLSLLVDALIFGLVPAVMLVGLFGLVIPIFPGGVVIWLAGLGYGLKFGFGLVGWIVFVLMTILMIAVAAADNLLMGAKAREEGASWLAIILGLLAGVIGTLLFPPLGGLIAAPLVLFLVQYLRVNDFEQALRVLRGLLIGFGLAFIVRFILGLAMIALWVIWVLANTA